MTDEEKKVYQDKAAELKAEYDKAVEADNAEDGDANAKVDNAEEGEVSFCFLDIVKFKTVTLY